MKPDSSNVVRYQHTQTATLLTVMFGAVLALLVALGLRDGAVMMTALVAAVLVVVMLTFHALTVTVTNDAVEVRFGVGWFRRRIPLERIRAVRARRRPWYAGWGIRWIPGGWHYSVQGLDVVEVDLAGGGRVWIGTDEPDKLAQALESALRDVRR